MIDRLGGFLQHNLVVCLAVVLIPLKIIVLRFCGDAEALGTAFLAVPEDVGYVSLGLILGDVAASERSFRRYFHGSANVSIDLVLVLALNVSVAVLTHILAKWGQEHFKSFQAAGITRTSSGAGATGLRQLEMPITPDDENIHLIQVRHLAMFSISYAIQIFVTIRWLAWIAKVVAYG